jgi:hypothetical protein
VLLVLYFRRSRNAKNDGGGGGHDDDDDDGDGGSILITLPSTFTVPFGLDLDLNPTFNVNVSTLQYEWSLISGPGSVIFDDFQASEVNVIFGAPGVFVLELSVTNSIVTSTKLVTITITNDVTNINLGPLINANFGTVVELNPNVNNPGDLATFLWTKTSGPGMVDFTSPTTQQSDVTFSSPGSYVLRLSVTYGTVTEFSEVVVVINGAPVVSAGPNKTGLINTNIALNGSVTDDGINNGSLVIGWSTVSGPSVPVINNLLTPITSVNITTAGVYVLRLSANDGFITSISDVTVTVSSTPFVNATYQARQVFAEQNISCGQQLAKFVGLVDDNFFVVPATGNYTVFVSFSSQAFPVQILIGIWNNGFGCVPPDVDLAEYDSPTNVAGLHELSWTGDLTIGQYVYFRNKYLWGIFANQSFLTVTSNF